jgi:hypothetical protein
LKKSIAREIALQTQAEIGQNRADRCAPSAPVQDVEKAGGVEADVKSERWRALFLTTSLLRICRRGDQLDRKEAKKLQFSGQIEAF